jgi:hypothetical protein
MTLNKERVPLPTVEQSIARIEETDYKLVHRSRGYYLFRSDTRPPHCRTLSFTLAELRCAFKYGF